MTLGRTNISLNGLSCEAHIMPDSFPIDTDELLGWDMLTRHKGRIYARFRNMDEKIGFVPSQNLWLGILFGNFVAENKEGKACALCYNISEESITIKAPTVTLEPCEVMREKDGFLDIDHINDDEHPKFGQANVLRVHSEEETEKAAKIFEAIDPNKRTPGSFWTPRVKIKSHTFVHAYGRDDYRHTGPHEKKSTSTCN